MIRIHTTGHGNVVPFINQDLVWEVEYIDFGGDQGRYIRCYNTEGKWISIGTCKREALQYHVTDEELDRIIDILNNVGEGFGNMNGGE